MYGSNLFDEKQLNVPNCNINSTSDKNDKLIYLKKMPVPELSINSKQLSNISSKDLSKFLNYYQKSQRIEDNHNLTSEKSQSNLEIASIKIINNDLRISQKNLNCSSLTSNQIIKTNYNILTNSSNSNRKKRFRFTPEEDQKLKELVEIYGRNNWKLIATFMNGRQSRQCKERYLNYLVPGFFKGQWTNEEDDLLGKLYIENGPKWSFLQQYFPGRNANSLKNRWKYFLCKQEKYCNINEQKEVEMSDQSNEDELDLIENDDFIKNYDILTVSEDYQFLAQNNDIFNFSFI